MSEHEIDRRTFAKATGVTAGLLAMGGTPVFAARSGRPPGAPGVDPGYLSADKQGFGTARSGESPVWFTLTHGGTADLYYPNLSTPASRQLQVVVTDGTSFVQRLSDVPTRTELTDVTIPSYRQVSSGDGWEATATYVTDPARSSMMIDLHVTSQDTPLQIYVIHEPTLSDDGADVRSSSREGTLIASDNTAASALRAAPAFTETSSGYMGTSDGWTDLSQNKRLTAHHHQAGPGQVGQVGRVPIDGVNTSRAVLTLGYGPRHPEAVAAAEATERAGFDAVARAYADGWQRYADSLNPAPSSLGDEHQNNVYWSSIVMLAASEDKQSPGGFVASPSMPWANRNDEELSPEHGPYHLVWPRDLYQHATALLAAGDPDAAERALDYLWTVQEPDGHWTQNMKTTGEAFWTAVQLDQTAFPIVLAWQLGRTDSTSLDHVRKAAEFLVTFELDGYSSPYTEQERWENHSGYSPGTIAAAIAGLICAADLLERAGDTGTPKRYRSIADDWVARVDGWTATSNGPHSPKPYYLRVTKDGRPNRGTTYDPGNNWPHEVDQRAEVDPSFLELVRLGVKRPDDPVVLNSIEVVDEVISDRTPSGRIWYRFTSDGYGERADGGDWNIGHGRTYGRLWPLLTGERGEYELLAGRPGNATAHQETMAASTNAGLQLPEQVWDNRAPADDGTPKPGTPTRSATPLAWTHAQYVRLAISREAGAPVETPSVVAERYARG